MDSVKKERKFKFPDTAFLLFVIIVVVAALTYIVPAGQYERVFDEETNKERLAVGEKLGLEQGKNLFSLFMEYEAEYNTVEESLCQVFKSVDAYKDIYAAPTARSRYVYEDVPTGLVPFMAMAELLGLPYKKMQLTVKLCEEMLCENLVESENCRNLKNLGLQGMSAEQIISYAKTGVK